MTNSRRKGKVGELQAAAALRALGIAARRGQQHSGSPDSPDVQTALPGVHIEVKRAERFNAYTAMAQAETDGGDLKCPVVLHRRNNKPWLLVVKLEDLKDLYAALDAVWGGRV